MTRTLRGLCLALVAASALAQESDPFWEKNRISVVAFGDYYAVLGHHDEELEGRDGFWIRRVYLTLDQKVSDELSSRVRLEMAHPGDFSSSSSMEPFVKDAWLRWKRSDALNLVVGIQPSPAFDAVEEFWGYRTVEKTPLDLLRWRSTRDVGVGVSGRMGVGGRFSYHAVAGNGHGVGAEVDDGKLLAVAAGWSPSRSTIVQLYGDHEVGSDGSERATIQALLATRRPRWRAGLQLAQQEREVPGAGDLDLALGSVFAVWNARDDVSLLLRVDRMFDPMPDGDRIAYLPIDPSSKGTLTIAGADFRLHRGLGVIPNVEWVAYDREGASDPDDDFLARLTFYYSF